MPNFNSKGVFPTFYDFVVEVPNLMLKSVILQINVNTKVTKIIT